MKKVKYYNMGESLLNSILFLIFGVILFTNPNGVVKFGIYALGAFAILAGIFKLLVYCKTAQYNPSIKEIVNGIIYLLIGTATILCSFIFFDAIETVLRLAVATFLLYIGVNRLISAFKVPKRNKVFYLINSLLIIGSGIALALIQGLPFKIIGLFIIGYAILELISFILYHVKIEPEENGIEEAKITKIENTCEDRKLLK